MGGNATSPLHSRGSPTKGTRSNKKKQKNKNKNCPMLSLILPTDLQMTPLGFEPRTFQLQRHCFTTRVWPNSDIPLHRGGIHIWSNLVFIHYWVILKTEHFEYRHMGWIPIFSPSTKSSKISLGRLRRPWSGTFQPKPSREGGGGSA